MQAHLEEIRRAGGEVLALSVDAVEKNAEVVRKLHLDFAVLADVELGVADVYDLRHKAGGMEGNDITRPAVFILDREGVIRWRSVTDNWRVRVRPETVLEELSSLP